MVTFSKAQTVEHAGQYYEQHYSSKIGEYYAPTNAPIVGQALGKGAEALGIKGDITAEQFEALLRGQDPTSSALIRMKATRADAKERAGWDCTISPPKSISIHALVAGDIRLIEADRLAAIRAIQEAEKCALGREHGGRQWVESGNVIAVMFEHFDARESIGGEHGPMPQLHHHFFLVNATQLPNGQWRSLDPDQMLKARNYIDSIYMSELARNVQELGYSITRGADGSFELKGYTRQQVEAFSERAKDINRVKDRDGITNPKDARKVVLDTRLPKREYDRAQLKAEREALAVEHGINLDYRPLEPVRSIEVSPDYQAQRSLEFAIRHGTNREAVVDHRDIVRDALRHGVGATDLDHLQAQIKAQQASGQLIAAGNSPIHPVDRYTTREMALLERENRALVRDLMNHGRPIAGIAIRSAVDGTVSSTGDQEVREWAARRHLLSDQADAALLTLTTPKWASAIEGLAGTTKTTLVGAVKEFAEEHNWTVRGFGTTTGARDALSDAGVSSQTIAQLRATPLPTKTGRELWIIDESSLLATVPVNELLKIARDRGVERLLFVGDQKQHVAIEAGSPVRQFLADNMVVARLTTIRRQQDPELRRVVELSAAGRTDEAIDLLSEQGRLVEVPEAAQRYDRIAAEYLNAYEARQNCLVVAPANDERKAINEAIRSTLVEHQYVGSLGQQHQILIPRDMTPEQLHDARSYHEGEVLYFTRGSRAQHIPKRSYLTVAGLNDETLTLRTENGRLLTFDPTSLKGIRVYTTETRTIAAGDRLQWREPDKRRGIANGEYATIKKLDTRNIEVKFDKGKTLAMPISEARKVDLGYASTSHKAQGSTVERAILHIDSSRSPELVNQRMFYVGDSREKLELRVYTDSIQGMRRAVARTQDKELALDVVEKQQHGISMRM